MHGFNAAMTLEWLQDFGRAYHLHRANATLTHESTTAVVDSTTS